MPFVPFLLFLFSFSETVPRAEECAVHPVHPYATTASSGVGATSHSFAHFRQRR